MSVERCAWAASDPLLRGYHDEEWGVPLHDDTRLFEMLTLEGFQAGLSWLTVLRKRDAFRRAFGGFDPVRVAAFDGGDLTRLEGDAGIIRNRAKIRAAVGNAGAFLRVQGERGSFDAYAWAFVGGAPLVHRPASSAEVPAASPESRAFSRDLKRRGFAFVGPTVVYAFMQATGMVMDHTVACFRHAELAPST